MAIFDIFTDPNTGKYSSHRFWYSVANVVTTWIIIRLTLQDHLTLDFFLSYSAMVGGYSVATRLINRTQPASATSPKTEEVSS